MKISIVIPIHNVELYLDRCIESCVQQDITFENYEIILVNDGSTDKSGDIAKDWESRYSNIRLLEKENGGLSSARNVGLNVAEGEYIWFVDSDDWIEKNILNTIINSLSEGIDVLSINYRIVKDDVIDIKSGRKGFREDNIYNGICYLRKKNQEHGAPFYVIRKQFLENNELTFKEGTLHEDNLFTPQLLFLANKIRYCNSVAYYYFKRIGSITNSEIKASRCINLLDIADELILFKESKAEDIIESYVVAKSISGALAGYYKYWKQIKNISERSNLAKEFTKRKYTFVILQSLRWKYLFIVLRMRCYLISPK